MRRDPPPDRGPAGLYVHFPFCASRCAYCDFPTVTREDDRIHAYLDALRREIAGGQPGLSEAADTVYLGGGTPSRMSPAQVAGVLAAVRQRFRLSGEAEVTLEGNPESLTANRLAGYREAGVNRISIGAQSLDDTVLLGVGRAHDAAETVACVRRAREAGFDNVNVDLLLGLPGEDVGSWTETVERVAALEPEHVSMYLLETDKDTPLARSIRAGCCAAPSDDAMADAFRAGSEALERGGLVQYEISNFARAGCESKHNLKYWTDAAYGGFGLGSHAYVRGARRANREDLDGYVVDAAGGRDPVAWREPWDAGIRLSEALVFGLRLTEGVDLRELGERYGADLRAIHGEAWELGLEAELIELHGDRVRLTPSGRMRSNELFQRLMAPQ